MPALVGTCDGLEGDGQLPVLPGGGALGGLVQLPGVGELEGVGQLPVLPGGGELEGLVQLPDVG